MNKKTEVFLMCVLVTAGLLLMYILYLIFYPVKTVTIESPLKILNSPVKAGEIVEYEIRTCKFTNLPNTTSRVLVNHNITGYPDLSANVDKGCMVYLSKNTTIPDCAPPGMYKIQFSTVTQVNQFQKDVVRYETELFEVIK